MKTFGELVGKYAERVVVTSSSDAEEGECRLRIDSSVNEDDSLASDAPRKEVSVSLTVPLAKELRSALDRFIAEETDVRFIVTEEARRPASNDNACFYCNQLVGTEHKNYCVLIKKKVKIRLTFEQEFEIPASWGAVEVEREMGYISRRGTERFKQVADLASGYDGVGGGSEFSYSDEDSKPYLKER